MKKREIKRRLMDHGRRSVRFVPLHDIIENGAILFLFAAVLAFQGCSIFGSSDIVEIKPDEAQIKILSSCKKIYINGNGADSSYCGLSLQSLVQNAGKTVALAANDSCDIHITLDIYPVHLETHLGQSWELEGKLQISHKNLGTLYNNYITTTGMRANDIETVSDKLEKDLYQKLLKSQAGEIIETICNSKQDNR